MTSKESKAKMIANSEDKVALQRMAGRLCIALGLAATAGIVLSAAATPVRLVGVTTEGNTVLIESTEPVAYSVSRPDALSLVVDMRNVSVSDARADVAQEGAIAGVRLEQASATDGRALARVHVALAKPTEFVVRSARNTIRVELKGAASPSMPRRADQGRDARTEAVCRRRPRFRRRPRPRSHQRRPGQGRQERPGRRVRPAGGDDHSSESSRARPPGATTVTLVGNGRLASRDVTESKDRPRRLVIDLPNVTSTGADADRDRQPARDARPRRGQQSSAARHARRHGNRRIRDVTALSEVARAAATWRSCSSRRTPRTRCF